MIQETPKRPDGLETWDAPPSLRDISEEELTRQFNHFVDWTNCVNMWQVQVTNDIRRIKDALAMGKANPDDPPPPPWRPKP